MKANIRQGAAERERSRVFFALWPAPAQRRRLHDLAVRWRKVCGGRAMRAETLHLTLLFVGEVPRQRLEQLCAAADGIGFGPFGFSLRQFTCWRHNHIGYATTADDAAELGLLADALGRALAAAGFEFDRRAFAPHITLLRNIERPLDPQPIEPAIEWPVAAFSLVESLPTGRAVVYRTLKTWRCQE